MYKTYHERVFRLINYSVISVPSSFSLPEPHGALRYRITGTIHITYLRLTDPLVLGNVSLVLEEL